jgi:hypothetical protein
VQGPVWLAMPLIGARASVSLRLSSFLFSGKVPDCGQLCRPALFRIIVTLLYFQRATVTRVPLPGADSMANSLHNRRAPPRPRPMPFPLV